jgi:poly(3-hydroxybutyrate) depolymerase
MKLPMKWHTVLVVAVLLTTVSGLRAGAQLTQIAGVSCASPPPHHCPESNCPRELIAKDGNAVVPKSNRAFFLDYPCDLKPGEAVTFVLNLHGGGSIGNWQRHYYPIMDLKDKYRLVVATPSAVRVLWSPEDDDAHLRDIVNFVFGQFGAKRLKAFWLAGHSHGRKRLF